MEDGYKIMIYDKWNKMIKTDYSVVEPGVSELDDNIIEVVISTGNPASYIYYFDKKNIKLSKMFFNPILIENKYIAYMEEGALIITDLFQEGLLYKKIVRNFTKTANPSSAIIDIEIQDEENFMINYYKGEDYKEEMEVIPIYK